MCIVEYPPAFPTQTAPLNQRLNNNQLVWPDGWPYDPLVPGDYPYEPKKWVQPSMPVIPGIGTTSDRVILTTTTYVAPPRFQSRKDSKNLILTLDLPGVKAANLNVKIKDGRQLVVSHSRFDRNAVPQIDTYMFENDVDVERLTVAFEACVLTVTYEERRLDEQSVKVTVKDM